MDMDSISAELNGVAALICCISLPFLDGENTASQATIGDALFAVQSYVERIKDSVDKINRAK